jgi:chaperonin GroEL
MLDILGSDGAIVVQEFMGPYLDRQYVDGLRYEKGGYASPHFITNQARREAVLEEPWVLITDMEIERPGQLVGLLAQIAKGDKRPLVVIAREVKGAALATLVVNHQKKVVPGLGINFKLIFQIAETLEDMALMTGGRFLSKEASHRLEDASLADLGRARRVIAGRDQFTIVGGHGDREAVRKRARDLRAQLSRGAYEKEHESQLRKRLGLLAGGIGILKFGSNSEQERKAKRAEIESVLAVLSSAMQGGVVPGGGAAYLACIPAVRGLQADGDEAIGIDIMARALEAPMSQIVKNAGLHAPLVLAEAQRSGTGCGYDVLTEQVTNMEEAGIMDSLRVLRDALGVAASGGCMALTAGAIVLREKPEQSLEP